VVGHALVALFLLSGDLRLQADGTSESRAGEAPIVAGENPRPFVAEILTPLVALVYRDQGLIFEASYAPRFYWADPNPIGRWAPLLLHTANLLFDDQMTPRFRLLASATGSIGQADYTALPQLLGTVQGALPPIQDLASVSAKASGRGDITERWKLELGAQGLYWRWLQVPAGLPPQTITSQASASELANALFRLNLRHELGFGALFGQARYSYGLEVFSLGPTVTWKVRLTPGEDLRLMLGLAYVRAGGTTPPGTTPPLGASGQAVSPVGAFEFQSLVARQNQVFISTVASGGVDFYLDPVIGSAVPRASVEAGVAAVMPPNWLATFKGGFATPLRTVPLAVPANGTPFDETAFTLRLGARRRFSLNFFGEVGVLWADRGPALVTPNFSFHQRQLWFYVELIGTTRPLPQAPQTPK
jgi:hypothetical protein